MDMQGYLKLQQWTLIEAACLISGIEPVAEQVFDKDLKTGGKPAVLYRELKDAIKLKQLQAWETDGTWQRLRVLPEEAASWARLRGYEIPAALEGLVFRVRGVHGHGNMTRAEYEEHQARLGARRSEGRYTLEEAAQAIEAATGERADVMLKKLMAAGESGDLPVYGPGENARYLYGPGHASCVREFYEEARWNELNDWLGKTEPYIAWQFPDPSANADEVAITNNDAAPGALPKKAILAAPWPLPNGRQLAPLLSDVPKWLEPARTSRGSPGKGSSTWNPALIADCLATTSKGKTWVVNHQALTNFLNRHFQKWVAEWEKLSEYR